MSERRPEHGTLTAYITGFILSVIFTFIPYYLVVNHVMTGTGLLAIILAIGIVQMIIQLLFFLHLGRKPRPRWQIGFLGATVFAVLVVVGGSIIITSNLHHNMMPSQQVLRLANDEGIYQVGGQKTGACEGQHANHQVIIIDDTVFPTQTAAQHCDTLTFRNHGKQALTIVFGDATDPTPYAGVASYSIRPGQNQTITLSESGSYSFHDDARASTGGTFTVGQ